MIFTCKVCKVEFSRRPSSHAKYCSRTCMLKDPEYHKAVSNGVKKSINKDSLSGMDKIYRMVNKANEARIKKYGKKENRLVRSRHSNQVLNITYKELEEYYNTHLVCEICGRPERVSTNKKTISKLCCDHDHKTCKFRGLLCCDCNRKLGWYEKLEDSITKYLNKS